MVPGCGEPSVSAYAQSSAAPECLARHCGFYGPDAYKGHAPFFAFIRHQVRNDIIAAHFRGNIHNGSPAAVLYTKVNAAAGENVQKLHLCIALAAEVTYNHVHWRAHKHWWVVLLICVLPPEHLVHELFNAQEGVASQPQAPLAVRPLCRSPKQFLGLRLCKMQFAVTVTHVQKRMLGQSQRRLQWQRYQLGGGFEGQ